MLCTPTYIRFKFFKPLAARQNEFPSDQSNFVSEEEFPSQLQEQSVNSITDHLKRMFEIHFQVEENHVMFFLSIGTIQVAPAGAVGKISVRVIKAKAQ